MGKKKRSYPDIEEILARPWCYYCERDFEDLKLLISHQKAKHFKCDRCGRRLNTAGGLAVHMNQVHKETLTEVAHANPGRQGLEVEIFGMEGIPHDMLEQHKTRIVQNFYQAQEDRRIATGNPVPGRQNQPRKKIKIESPEELKARLHEYVAQRKADKAAGAEGAAAPAGVYTQGPPGAAQTYPSYTGMGAPTGLPTRPGQPQYWPAPGGAPGYPAGPPPGVSGADDIDQLIASAKGEPSSTLPPPPGPSVTPVAAGATEAKADKKKKKEKDIRMIYSDSEVSPEEKMAMLPRYAQYVSVEA